MKSKKGDLTWDKLITIMLVVIAVIVISIIIFLNKEKMGEILASLARVLRFGA